MKLNKNSFIAAVIVFVAVVGFWYVSYILDVGNKETVKTVSSEISAEEETEGAAETKEEQEIKVYITGEINNPGTYSAKPGSRVEDIVNMAGGFKENADKENINMARHVNDAEHIVIKNVNDAEKDGKSSETDGKLIVNINTADADELKKLNGIGDSIAEDIINYRNENGGFQKIEDIKNVAGIAAGKFEKIKDNITVS